MLPGGKPGQRLGRIDTKKSFDAVLLVLLDENFEATAIHEAGREPVLAALSKTGSRARSPIRRSSVSSGTARTPSSCPSKTLSGGVANQLLGQTDDPWLEVGPSGRPDRDRGSERANQELTELRRDALIVHGSTRATLDTQRPRSRG